MAIMLYSYYINGRDFSPLSNIGTTASDDTKWYTVDDTGAINAHQTAVPYANAVGIAAVYSNGAITGKKLPSIIEGDYDIWCYIRSYASVGAKVRVNGGTWIAVANSCSDPCSWVKMGTLSLKTGDLLEFFGQGGGATTIIKDICLSPKGVSRPTVIPTGKEGSRTLLVPVLRTNVNDMQIGDRIAIEYTATSNSFGTISNLGKATKPEIPVTSSATPDGTAYFYHTGYDLQGRMKLVADRNIQHSISWDMLNTAGVASGSGLPIKIDGKDGYTVRLLSGGISATDKDNEWDKIIAESTLNGTVIAGDNSVWNWNDLYGQVSTQYCIVRAKSSVAIHSAGGSTGDIRKDFGFRPVLLVEVKSTNVKIDKVTPTHMYKNNAPCIINASIISEDPAVTCKFKLSINGVEDAMYMDEIPAVSYNALRVGPNTVTVLASASDGTLCSAVAIIIKEEDHRTKVERTFTAIDGGYILNNIKLDNNAKAIN